MDELRDHLAPILKNLEMHYGWVFEKAALEYLMHYFHSLSRFPTQAEVMLCGVRAQERAQGLILIPGHKIDAFYAQATVLETAKPDLLDIPEIPSDVKPSDMSLQERMVDLEAERAHNLMASSSRLPRRVVSVLEEQYWLENHYTLHPGYHHYEHSEGESCYGLTVNPAGIPGAFSSRGVLATLYGSSLDRMVSVSRQWIRQHNQRGYPLLSVQFRENQEPQCTSTGFSNVLPYPGEERKIKPGDRLFLLGKLSEAHNITVENQFQTVIFNAYALGNSNPVFRVFNLEHQSLALAVLSMISQSTPGCGVQISLDLIPKPHEGWNREDFWTQPLFSHCLVVVPGYQKHILEPLIEREDCPCIEIGAVTELGEVVFLRGPHEDPLIRLEWTFLEHFPVRSIEMDTPVIGLFPEASPLETGKPFYEELVSLLKQLTVLDKSFWVTQVDRTCTGLVARDIMVGPWQVPVADVGVTLTEFKDYRGEAMALGECLLSPSVDHVLAAKTALGEAVTNLAAAAIEDLSMVHFMISDNECSVTVCDTLTQCIEGWEASLNKLSAYLNDKQVMAFGGVSITAFAPVVDVRKTLTPQWVTDDDTDLMAVIWEMQSVEHLHAFFKAIQTLNRDDFLLAYHDLSEGGLVRCLLEMAFCSHCGFSVDLPGEILPFERYMGAVIQIRHTSQFEVTDFLNRYGFEGKLYHLGTPLLSDQVVFKKHGVTLYEGSWIDLHRLWSLPGVELQKRESDTLSDESAHQMLPKSSDPGLHESMTFDPNKNIILPYIGDVKPSVAILRFPGGLGHLEMAAAFDRVGFECIDVSILDMISGKEDLSAYSGLAIGGSGIENKSLPFAESVVANDQVRGVFESFFQKPHTFTLGVGEGCQWLASIKEWVPGAEHWPSFQRNVSNRFESRWVLVKVQSAHPLFFHEMEGSIIPVPVACMHGKLLFPDKKILQKPENQLLVPLVYVDHDEQISEQYPFNPTGSLMGICGFSNQAGRVLGMIGHPERACRSSQQSWRHRYLQMDAPWLRIFRNARAFVGSIHGATFFDPAP